MAENPWGPDVAPHSLEEFDAAQVEQGWGWNDTPFPLGTFAASPAAWVDDWWPIMYLQDAETATASGPVFRSWASPATVW